MKGSHGVAKPSFLTNIEKQISSYNMPTVHFVHEKDLSLFRRHVSFFKTAGTQGRIQLFEKGGSNLRKKGEAPSELVTDAGVQRESSPGENFEKSALRMTVLKS